MGVDAGLDTMTGRVEGKVAFVSGAARGQGRSHAVRLAEEGADIIAIDVCGPIDNLSYPHATPEDLDDTVDLVKGLGRRIVTARVDVRDYEALKAVVDSGVEQLGRLDIIVANAGVGTDGRMLHKIRENVWQDMIDINLSGVWHTVKAGVPHVLSGGRGGSIVLTSSVGGRKAYPNTGHYIAAQARCDRADARLCRGTRAAHDSGQFGAAHPGQYHDVDERAVVSSVPPGSGESRSGRLRPDFPDDAHPAGALGRSDRYQQRRIVSRL